MKKKHLGMTTAMATSLLAVPACAPNDDWNDEPRAYWDTAVCVDRDGSRVEDYRCEEGRYGGSGASNGFLWYYLGRNSALPYYGDSIRDPRYRLGSYTPRPGATYDRAPVSTAMTRSSAVSRGGLGSSGRFFGGSRS